jgi:hypothetical protein
MNRKLGPCSLTKLIFTGEKKCENSSWIDIPKHLATKIV